MAASTQIWLGSNICNTNYGGRYNNGGGTGGYGNGRGGYGGGGGGGGDTVVMVDITAVAEVDTVEEGTGEAYTMVGAEEVMAPTVTVADTPMAAGVAMEVQEVAVIAAVPLEGTAVAVVADVGDTMVMVAVEAEVAGTIMEVTTMARISLGATIAVVDMVVGHRGGEVGVKDTDHESTFRTLRM